ncbi:SAM-dependent methyltransferase [Spongiactinospora sp. 9N601]|uniref:SAM-dependent methyltransferase n=1 Tax=Spongiactinospora sp. 9N601 TaxID=3375149 RepID=UPI0037A8861B
MTERETAPPEINTGVPSVARVYDHFLGGKDNFAADRAVVAEVIRAMPPGWRPSTSALDNRAFLRRAVRYLVRVAGVRQFLDIGSGLPTQGNVHQVAQAAHPDCRVVYVDNDPIVLVHARALLARDPGTTVITADIRRPTEILDNPVVRGFIDFQQPVGLLLVGILHHIHDHEDPGGIARRLVAGVPPDSYLAISHFRDPGPEHPEESELAARREQIFTERLGVGRWRTQEEIVSFFGDLELVEPGVVPLQEWRPDPGDLIEKHEIYHTFVGGVGRKR